METNRELVYILNQLIMRKIPLILAKLRDERSLSNNKGPEDVFSYNTLTHKTTISLPRDTMLVIPDHLSLQLGLRGKVYLGRRTKATEVTDVNFRNHTVYVYTDLIRNVVVGDTEAPLLRCMAVKISRSHDHLQLCQPRLHPLEHQLLQGGHHLLKRQRGPTHPISTTGKWWQHSVSDPSHLA